MIIPSTYEEESKGKFDPSDVYSYITGIALGKVKQVGILVLVYNSALGLGSDTQQ